MGRARFDADPGWSLTSFAVWLPGPGADTGEVILSDLTLPLLVLAGVLGACVGSFVNVVAYRVPAGMSLSRPGSACPSCEHPIRARHNVPVLGWLVLRGRCFDCSARIAVRYPLVEAVTAGLFVAICWRAGFSAATPFLLWAAGAGVALFLIDLDTFRLPDKVSAQVAGAAVGATAATAVQEALSGRPVTPLLVVAGAAALMWLALFAAPYVVTRGRGVGFGDVKLAPSLGLLLGLFGWGTAIVGYFAGILLGTVVGVALMAAGKAGRKTAVPYGPFMLVGALVGLFWGNDLLNGYMALFAL